MVCLRILPFFLAIVAMRAQPPGFEKPVFTTDTMSPQAGGAAELLEAVCPGQVVAGKQITCRGTCKTFPGGGSDWVGDWEITGVLRGHFLAPDSDDAVLSENGCQPHVADWGGSFLLTREAGGWKELWFKA